MISDVYYANTCIHVALVLKPSAVLPHVTPPRQWPPIHQETGDLSRRINDHQSTREAKKTMEQVGDHFKVDDHEWEDMAVCITDHDPRWSDAGKRGKEFRCTDWSYFVLIVWDKSNTSLGWMLLSLLTWYFCRIFRLIVSLLTLFDTLLWIRRLWIDKNQ